MRGAVSGSGTRNEGQDGRVRIMHLVNVEISSRCNTNSSTIGLKWLGNCDLNKWDIGRIHCIGI